MKIHSCTGIIGINFSSIGKKDLLVWGKNTNCGKMMEQKKIKKYQLKTPEK